MQQENHGLRSQYLKEEAAKVWLNAVNNTWKCFSGLLYSQFQELGQEIFQLMNIRRKPNALFTFGQ